MINYNKKRFISVKNSDNGEVSKDLIFTYNQTENIVTSNYQGGKILKGQLIGLVNKNGEINIRYQQVNTSGELKTGICHTTPEIMDNGKIRLHEKWQWTSGDKTSGNSILEEL